MSRSGVLNLFKITQMQKGLYLGAMGYVIFFAAPALGMPPELPGTVAANLIERQYWFMATVFFTALGLMLLILPSKISFRLSGFFLLILPHAYGAPHPSVYESLAPEFLQTQFIWATSLSNAFFWLILGVLSLMLFRFFSPVQKTS